MDREVVKIADLKAAPYNPRRISKEASDGLTKSLERWGVVQEVVANKRTGHIVGGHQRVAALRKMGQKEVPVVWVDLDDVEEKALNVALNNPHISGEFDDTISGLLAEIREGIGPEDFADLKLDYLLPPETEVVEGNTDPDDVPEMPEDPITKLGDLWILGNHRLLCGDSTNIHHVERLMGGNKWHSMTTSPPYNQGESNGSLMHTKGLGVGKKNASLYQDKNSDNRTPEEYFDFCISILSSSYPFRQEEDHSVCWNVAYNSKSRDDYGKIIFSESNPYRVKETIIWDKSHSINLPQVGIYSRRCEFVFVMSANDKYRTSQTYNDCRWNYWMVKSAGSQITGESVEHRAAFPVEFALKMVSDFSLQGDNIYEPFCGSGTTLIASEQIGRQCYGMEISPKYCDVIVKRWEEFTGNKAVLEASDATG